ncbi:MAG: sulfatase-like hydrolase/transferase [Anaerolineales bacterium]|nr:sulfatase-like hydrolase/transferase [Anaerolineales bacterium]
MKVILIDIDTLRADHLSCYGYRYPTSPHIDRLAEQGTLFEFFFAPNIPTQPAHTTIYSGQHAVTHGIAAHSSDIMHLPAGTPWLTSLLKRAGVLTAAVDNLDDQKPWFSPGYAEYYNPLPYALGMHSAKQVNDVALPWLQRHAHEDFFLFLHPWDPHTPYEPPEPYRERFYEGNRNDPAPAHPVSDWAAQPAYPFFEERMVTKLQPINDLDYIRALYDAEIASADEHIGVLMDALDELGIADETLVLLTSDHGEIMMDHIGYFDHAGLYEGNIRIPLIVRGPGVQAGRRLSGMAQHIDLAPTVLECFGQPVPAAMEGRGLWDALQGSDWAGYETIYLTEATWEAKWGIRTEEWKLIKTVSSGVHGVEGDELYHLTEDPDENRNLIESAPEVADQLDLQLVRWRDDMLGKRPDPVRLQAVQGCPAEHWQRALKKR